MFELFLDRYCCIQLRIFRLRNISFLQFCCLSANLRLIHDLAEVMAHRPWILNYKILYRSEEYIRVAYLYLHSNKLLYIVVLMMMQDYGYMLVRENSW